MWLAGAVLIPVVAAIPAYVEFLGDDPPQQAAKAAQARLPSFARATKITYAGSGVLYAIFNDGTLHRFVHADPEGGGARWLTPQGEELGGGWNRFRWLEAGANGSLYAVDASGELFRFTYQPGARLEADSGRSIGQGFNVFEDVSAVPGNGSDQIIYGLRPNGDLCWHRYLGPEAAEAWANAGRCKVIKRGWQRYRRIIALDDGVLFTIDERGNLHWHRQREPEKGGTAWYRDDYEPNGIGWLMDLDETAFRGVFYALLRNGELRWLKYVEPGVYKPGYTGWTHLGRPLFPAGEPA
ncbi:tachylectin-related carbohydrate-binding protein [Nonomuraea sp. SYSU D8015]|uniref:tachylectin-related carbohydrate-binding protein n=1 Tax=Nonomuraea sp. SYSU D8015 TaxID=2593644 RepID=UPI0016604C60|nr:tachylectin-related carbohydrate-binding protein [Nonomuraea sp. SYSU D8015]